MTNQYMLTFNKATIGDIPTLQQLAHTIWHSHYPGIISVEQIEYMLDLMYSASVIHKEITSGYEWIIILLEEQPIGLVSFHLEQEAERVKLNKLYLLPEYHGKGFGQQALNYIIDCSRNLNAKILYLTVNKNNPKAINAYYRAGFYKESEIVSDIGNGYVMDDFVMAYKL
jgi:RimJ/RimL family protein N-acetyltransferase